MAEVEDIDHVRDLLTVRVIFQIGMGQRVGMIGTKEATTEDLHREALAITEVIAIAFQQVILLLEEKMGDRVGMERVTDDHHLGVMIGVLEAMEVMTEDLYLPEGMIEDREDMVVMIDGLHRQEKMVEDQVGMVEMIEDRHHQEVMIEDQVVMEEMIEDLHQITIGTLHRQGENLHREEMTEIPLYRQEMIEALEAMLIEAHLYLYNRLVEMIVVLVMIGLMIEIGYHL